MKAPKNKPNVKLIGQDGNAFAIMGKVQNALKKAGADAEYVKGYIDAATSGNYDNLLQVTMEYVNVE